MKSSFSHAALLVTSVEQSANFLNTRGIQTEEPETFESEGTKEIYVGDYAEQSGLLLLLESIAEGPYRRALKKRGPSLHHLAIDVLDINEAVLKAQSIGWQLHPISEQTLVQKTAWLFAKGIPTLIEVHQKKQVSSNPVKVSKLQIPIQTKDRTLFEGIGLGEIVTPAPELILTVDGIELSFAQIAGLK